MVMFQNELYFMPSVDFFSGGGNEKKNGLIIQKAHWIMQHWSLLQAFQYVQHIYGTTENRKAIQSLTHSLSSLIVTITL